MRSIINNRIERGFHMWIMRKVVDEDRYFKWEIGYDLKGKFHSIFTETDQESAIDLISRLNGNSSFLYRQDMKEILEDICHALEKITHILAQR